ncbi:hypothetical protein DMB66_21205 [Actinoplanes sp. ATCC 53533]|uniref:hypothetical protein n=1 Tax=Actinoplanes sp. ATCC 53533 TaxID=1288362 RepID=UPI000F7A4699|nr:hypothetical protein [Actinoplanes sp. ATCC 53533]RSM64033.1 hypothetical protein DMB66_21205 [Actinoplanes sp. ATCC 53533]
MLYLPLRAQLVMPYEHDAQARTWRCVRVTHGAAQSLAEQVVVADTEIAGAVAVPLGYPVGDDAYAAVWQGCTYLRWPSGHYRRLTDYLATAARRPGTVIVDLDRHTVRDMRLTLGRTAATLRRMLQAFVAEGLLAPLEPGDADHWGVYALTMPPHPVKNALASEPGS